MELIVEEIVSVEDLKKFEKQYNVESARGEVSSKTEFEYAWCLVRSKYGEDLRHGVLLLQALFKKTTDETAKRDYLFYLAVGHTRLKEYNSALKYVKAIQQVEPRNHQARELQEYIEKKMKRDGLLGMALVGGAVSVGLGALVGIGVALGAKMKK